jgi:flagellum-specific ATP synthase
VRAINGLLRVGVGQRIGLFAGSGVGKSVLLGMLARFTAADAVVVGLIGERGREVQEFVDESLGDGLSRAIVVATPADDAPVLRLRGARLATRLAEELRARGQRVLLLLDSLTRVAQAQREISLALGEPPTSKGYTPSVFSVIPSLVERAGLAGGEGGSVTAFYTVLMEEDDLNDPVVDAARAVLDGHIVLSRRLADRGQFPAIDVEASISRLMMRLTSPEERDWARRFRQLQARYSEQEDLINLGAYEAGSDPLTDQAIAARQAFLDYLTQTPDERVSLAESAQALRRIVGAERLPATANGG